MNDAELRSYFESKHPLIVNANTRFEIPDYLVELVDHFFADLTATGNAFRVTAVRFRSMRIFVSPACTNAEQRSIYDRYIALSHTVSRAA